MRKTRSIPKTAFLLAIASALQGQVPDVTGEWKPFRPPAVGPSSSPAENWVCSLPGAVFTLTHSVIPPFAMVRKDLGYVYYPSQPTITITEGTPGKPLALGFLQSQDRRRFQGELAISVKSATGLELSPGGCWIHLSLEESEDGSLLSGTARINTKISTRQCRSGLVKEFKNGAPFEYALIRVR